MGTVQELYETRVRPMIPAARLQLAKLILDDLAPSEDAVDVSTEWSDGDLTELSAYSMQQADLRESNAENNKSGQA